MLKFLGLLALILSSGLLGSAELKVVSLAPAVTELVFQLGQGDHLVGRSAHCDYPATAQNIPVAGDFGRVEVEKILQLRPQIVLANAVSNPQAVTTLRQNGIQVYCQQCSSPRDYLAWVAQLGKILHCPGAAQREQRRFQQNWDDVVHRRPALPRYTVAWVIWDHPLMLAGKNSLPDTLMTALQLRNIAPDSAPSYFTAAREFLWRQNPDVIVWTGRGKFPAQSRYWKNLTAVKKCRVIELPDCDVVLRPGPRLPAGLKLLRQKLEQLP